MNWQYLIISFFGIVVFSLVITTLLFYVHHNFVKRKTEQFKSEHPTEGRFFTRFLPLSLKNVYAAEAQSILKDDLKSQRLVTVTIYSTVVTLALMSVSFYLYFQRDRFFATIRLSSAEIEKLPTVHHPISSWSSPELPRISDLKMDLEKTEFVLTSARGDAEWKEKESQRSLTNEYEKVWAGWLKELGAKVKKCHFDEILRSNCNGKNAIYIILPSRWPKDSLEEIVKRGGQIWIVGPPLQIFDTKTPTLEWRALKFEANSRFEETDLVARADQNMSFGFDSGEIIPATSIFSGYRVLSESASFLGFQRDSGWEKVTSARVVGFKEGNSRVVFSDFSPTQHLTNSAAQRTSLDALSASILRYLLKKKYSTWAMWPKGRQFVASLHQQVGDSFGDTLELSEQLAEKHLNWTIYIASDLAQIKRSKIRRLAEIGEIACGGDSLDVFPKDSLKLQTIRLANCKKALSEIGKLPVYGFFPPKDAISSETLDSLMNLNFKYFINSRSGSKLVPNLILSSLNNVSLVEIDVFPDAAKGLWKTSSASSSLDQSLDRLHRTSILGGHFSFLFSNEMEISTDQLSQIFKMFESVESTGGLVMNSQQLAEWWVLRYQLRRGEMGSERLMTTYQPTRLSVEETGDVLRKPWSESSD